VLNMQKTLLRTLQERRLRPVGGNKDFSVDFRLVAATNRNLEELAERQRFRSDLLYRIRGIEIKLPPLRDRIEDIQEIALHKIKQLGKLYGLGTKGVFLKRCSTRRLFPSSISQANHAKYHWPSPGLFREFHSCNHS